MLNQLINFLGPLCPSRCKACFCGNRCKGRAAASWQW